MIVILDPLKSEVLFTSKIFDRPFDPSVPRLSLEDLISVIENPDLMIDPENDVDYIYYIKTLEGNITVLFSAYPVGGHLLASAFVVNPMKRYLNELAQNGLILNLNCSTQRGVISHELSLQY